MRYLLAFLFLLTLAGSASNGLGSTVDEYQVRVQGTERLFSTTPGTRHVNETTNIVVETDNDDITLTLGAIGSTLPAITCHGKWDRQQGDFTVLHKSIPDNSKSVQIVYGNIHQNKIIGKLIASLGSDERTSGYLVIQFTGEKGNSATFPSLTPEQPLTIAPPVRAEQECLSFDPRTTKIHAPHDHWLIIGNGLELLDFGPEQKTALEALKIIKHYAMDKVCYVKRAGPPVTFWFVHNNAPSGSSFGENCTSFSIERLQIRKSGENWQILDGNDVLLDFGPLRSNARQALNIITMYQFQQRCFTGSGDAPSFEYWLK